MEGVLIVLVGGVLFSQSWYLLGLYTEGRTMGLIVALLAVGIAASASGTMGTIMVADMINGEPNPALLALQMYAILWAVYGGAVAAHGLWNFEERAIGFHSAFLSVVSLAYLIAISMGAFTAQQLPDAAIPVLAGMSLILGVLSGMVFFHLAIPFHNLRAVAGWFLLVGSIIVAMLGFGVLFRLLG